MQVNLHGSLCITAGFLYCYGHRKKRNLAQSPRKYAIFTLTFKKNFLVSSDPSLCGEKDTPFPHLASLGAFSASTQLAPSALHLSPPTSTPGSAYV